MNPTRDDIYDMYANQADPADLAGMSIPALANQLVEIDPQLHITTATQYAEIIWEMATEQVARRQAAAALGRARTAKKAASSRENGKLGGRPLANNTKTITRRTLLGWDYTTQPTGENSWSIAIPTRPCHTGTYQQVMDAIENDTAYQLDKQSAYYNTAWFVRVRGQWRRVTSDDYYIHTLADRETSTVEFA